MHAFSRAAGRAVMFAFVTSPVVAGTALAQAPKPVPDERAVLERLVHAELVRHPKARPVDVYEMIHEAAYGAGNAGLDSAKAAAQLRTEWAVLKKPKPGERMIDTISPDGKFVRLHLRPWKAAGGARGPIGRAFIATAHEEREHGSHLERYWRMVETMGMDNKLPWPVDSVSMLGRRMAGSGFPPVPHSPGFQQAYAPAYRVLTAERADSLVRSLTSATAKKTGAPKKPAVARKRAAAKKG